jgi:hypothetical protein
MLLRDRAGARPPGPSGRRIPAVETLYQREQLGRLHRIGRAKAEGHAIGTPKPQRLSEDAHDLARAERDLEHVKPSLHRRREEPHHALLVAYGGLEQPSGRSIVLNPRAQTREVHGGSTLFEPGVRAKRIAHRPMG